MGEITKLVAVVVTAWLLHVFIVGAYVSKFADTATLGFRLVHALEIVIIMVMAFVVYFRMLGGNSVAKALMVTFVTLAILDGIGFMVSNQAREIFDAWHFVAAYASIGGVIFIVGHFHT
jgi:hypothetical protein